MAWEEALMLSYLGVGAIFLWVSFKIGEKDKAEGIGDDDDSNINLGTLWKGLQVLFFMAGLLMLIPAMTVNHFIIDGDNSTIDKSTLPKLHSNVNTVYRTAQWVIYFPVAVVFILLIASIMKTIINNVRKQR